MSQKVHNFLDHPPPLGWFGLFKFGKNLKFAPPPPLVPNLGKTLNWENFEFSEPPIKTRNISLKHLKLSKNHFKTNLFFLQRKYLKCAFIFEKKMKIWPPPSYQKVHILNCGLFDLRSFSTFWDFFNLNASLRKYSWT